MSTRAASPQSCTGSQRGGAVATAHTPADSPAGCRSPVVSRLTSKVARRSGHTRAARPAALIMLEAEAAGVYRKDRQNSQPTGTSMATRPAATAGALKPSSATARAVASRRRPGRWARPVRASLRRQRHPRPSSACAARSTVSSTRSAQAQAPGNRGTRAIAAASRAASADPPTVGKHACTRNCRPGKSLPSRARQARSRRWPGA